MSNDINHHAHATRYTYRIDIWNNGTWQIENDAARGTEDYYGTAVDFAREVLEDRMYDVASDRPTGRWRVLVWEGEGEHINTMGDDAEFADGWAETVRTAANY